MSSPLNEGYTLRYDGMKFGSETTRNGDDHSNIKAFGHKFSNIGALVMRYQLGQKNRAALIQEIAFQNYEQNPITKPAKGKDAGGEFETDPHTTKTAKTTLKLGQQAHGTLGRGRVWNERRQPILDWNLKQRSGEALLFDTIHKVVWDIGRNFGTQLTAQGFKYITAPADDNPQKHQAITEALTNKNYTIEKGAVHVLGEVLPMVDPNKIDLVFDPKGEKTPQENGFIISDGAKVNKRFSDRPLGWMIHETKKELVTNDLAEDSMRVIKIGITNFHQLSVEEQKLLMGGRLTQSSETRVSQNALFNGLYAICIEFNNKYDFDPEQLLGTTLENAAESITKQLKDPQNLDDFLTGVILDEMTRPLHVSMSTSERSEIPASFRDRFDSTMNNARAMAYAFDIRDSQNREVFIKDSETPISQDQNLIDVHVEGKLASPALSSGRHAAAILSTALLVGEQLFMEQLLRDAIKNDTVESLLRKVMGDSKDSLEIANKLKEMAASFEQNENGAIMGLQSPHCEQMVNYIRKVLKFDDLIELANHMGEMGMMTDDVKKGYFDISWPITYYWPHVEEALKNLYNLGELLQENERTSASYEGSKGINAGLVPLILKIDPELAKELKLSLEEGVFKVPDYIIKAEPVITKSEKSDSISLANRILRLFYGS